MWLFIHAGIIHCHLMTPYDDSFWSTLAQITACCLATPSHYLNQCWLINGALWYSPNINLAGSAQEMSLKNTLVKLLPYLPWMNRLTAYEDSWLQDCVVTKYSWLKSISYKFGNLHHKDKTLSWQSYIYHGKLYNWKDGIPIQTSSSAHPVHTYCNHQTVTTQLRWDGSMSMTIQSGSIIPKLIATK